MAKRSDYIKNICEQLSEGHYADAARTLITPTKNETIVIEKKQAPQQTNGPTNVNTETTKPVLIGDSWATGLQPHFQNMDFRCKGSAVTYSTTVSNNTTKQITDYLSDTKHNPEFILCYSGRNAGTRSVATEYNKYKKLVEACKGRTIYLIEEQYDCHHDVCGTDNTFSRKTIDALNAAMKKVCSEFSNAHFLELRSKGFKTVEFETDKNGNIISYRNILLSCCDAMGCNCTNTAKWNGAFHLKEYQTMATAVLKSLSDITGKSDIVKKYLKSKK